MSQPLYETDTLQDCVTRFAAGDDSALNELLKRSSARLEQLTRVMFRDFSRVHRWEETADVLQSASIRLYRALQVTRPTDVRGFFNLATLQIRRELTDLARRYFGPEGIGTNYETSDLWPTGAASSSAFDVAASSGSFDPNRLASWTEFHIGAEQLPADEREVFDLIYYQGISQAEAAKILGISERTIQRLWQKTRLAMHDTFDIHLPD